LISVSPFISAFIGEDASRFARKDVAAGQRRVRLEEDVRRRKLDVRKSRGFWRVDR
jgi:hypothetical protein